MVRGNWQRRVELNESRRQEAKQKKHRQDSKKVFKAQAQELVALLNSHFASPNSRRSIKIIHIWTDVIPLDCPPILDMLETDGDARRSNGKLRGRNRSASIESEKVVKKAHPRSKEAVNSSAEKESGLVEEMPRLCRSHFFTGKCSFASSGSHKRGSGSGCASGCRFAHYPNKYLTLNDAAKFSNNASDVTSACEQACPEPSSNGSWPTDGLLDTESMDMIYYFSLKRNDFTGEDSQQDHSSSLGDMVSEAMANKGCGIAGLVYLMIDECLLYDRYRNGLVVREDSLTSSDSRREISGNQEVVLQLPASILEHILAFLEDGAVASMCSVCKGWHQEIGKHSGNLWKNLLQRRKWPLPSVAEGDVNSVEREAFRTAFLSHYVAVRDLTAIQNGITGLLHRKPMDEREGCFRSFDSARGSPQPGNSCVGIKIWSPNRFLVGYRQDCSLRLFDSAERNGSNCHRLCRELISRSIDPYRKTKKRSCSLLDLDIDDDCIGCLLQVREDGTKAEAFVLTVLGREDFLIDYDSTEDDGTLGVVDIGHSVLNYLLSCEDVDHGLLQLHDYLRDGGDLDDVEVLVSPGLVACSYGRFMTEVSVSIPLLEGVEDDEHSVAMTMLFRKFFLVSSTVGAIVWMADSNFFPFHENVSLASLRNEEYGRHGCHIVAVTTNATHLACLLIEPSGSLQQPICISAKQLQTIETENGWASRRTLHSPLVILHGEVVLAQNTMLENENGEKMFKAHLTFIPCTSIASNDSDQRIELEDQIVVERLIKFRSTHILAICKIHRTNEEEDGNDDGLVNLVGQGFGREERTVEELSCYAILIDVPSRREIHRTCLAEDLNRVDGLDEEAILPLLVASNGYTVATAVWWSGVVMTGAETRQMTQNARTMDYKIEDSKSNSAKKKKKSGPKKNGKKDGFARGMSLRG